MVIVAMREGASVKDIGAVITFIEEHDLQPHISRSETHTLVGFNDTRAGRDLSANLEGFAGVDRVFRVSRPYKLASREFRPDNTVIHINDVGIGSEEFVVMAGPCAVESLDQVLETAHAVKAAGARILRGGAYKPRTSPYSFQGMGEKGLQILAEARRQTGLLVVTEVMDAQDIPLIRRSADILQVGARNMQNFSLLQELGRARCPVLLKRGMMSSLEELLQAAEYILSSGNSQVILCERGIRTFEQMTRNTLDISAVPMLRKLTHLPIVVDPSHAAGQWDLVSPLACAALAAGADGLIIEVHPKPEEALSDGPQALKPSRFAKLMDQLRRIAPAVGKVVPSGAPKSRRRSA